MKLLKLLAALLLLTQFQTAFTQDDVSEEEWSDEAPAAVATPIHSEDAAGEEEMPVYDESQDY